MVPENLGLDPNMQPLQGIPAFTTGPNTYFLHPTPQLTSPLSVESPGTFQDTAPGVPSSYQATSLFAPPNHIPGDAPSTPLSQFEVVLAKAFEWMEQNPGKKVDSDKLEGAFQQVDDQSWECLGCGETRTRRGLIHDHIRRKHLNNRGFHPCDRPGWYVIVLRSHDVIHPSDCSRPSSTTLTDTPGDLKRHKETHTRNKSHKCRFWQVPF
jgi:hypothetical protein